MNEPVRENARARQRDRATRILTQFARLRSIPVPGYFTPFRALFSSSLSPLPSGFAISTLFLFQPGALSYTRGSTRTRYESSFRETVARISLSITFHTFVETPPETRHIQNGTVPLNKKNIEIFYLYGLRPASEVLWKIRVTSFLLRSPNYPFDYLPVQLFFHSSYIIQSRSNFCHNLPAATLSYERTLKIPPRIYVFWKI